MSGPHRWLDEKGELSELERRVLESAQRLSAPKASKQQVWLALAAQLPTAPVSVGSTPSSPAASGVQAASGTQAVVTGSVLKALAVGFALGAASVGAFAGLASRESSPPTRLEAQSVAEQRPAPARAPRVASTSSPAPLAAGVEMVVEGRPRRPAQPEAAPIPQPSAEPAAVYVEPGAARAAFPDAQPVASAAPHSASPAPSGGLDRARLESQRVAEARGLLRAGNPGQALRLLAAISAEFPNGVLVQEREALTIDALLASGAREAARKRAADFVQRYPGSPHTLSAQRALQ